MEKIICDKCEKTINQDEIGLAYNLGFGVFHFCLECEPPGTVEEIIESMDLAINPIKEN